MLQSMGLQSRIRLSDRTELNWSTINLYQCNSCKYLNLDSTMKIRDYNA